MSKNKDEALLLKRKVSGKSPFLKYEQALRIALYAHFQNYEKFKAAKAAFGNFPLFAEALSSQLDAISALGVLFERYEIPLVKNNCKSYVKLPDDITQMCEICVADEIKISLMYEELLDFCDDKEDIKDIFYRLQALSCNDLLSAFRTLSQKETKEGSEKQLIERFNDFTALANDISSGNIDPQKINDLLGSLNLSMLSGAVIGGLGAVLTKEMGEKRDDE